MSEQLREKLATLSGEQLTEVKRQALEVLRGYSTQRGMSFPAEVLIVAGTKIHQAHRRAFLHEGAKFKPW